MSYKGSYLISKCELIPNGSSLEENYDITRGNPTINYYESVRSCLLYTSPSPRDLSTSRMPSSA